MSDERKQLVIRLLPKTKMRLEAAARAKNQSVQVFVVELITREVGAANDRQPIAATPSAPTLTKESPTRGMPLGMGLAEQMRLAGARRQEEEEAATAATPASTPVVVNVGNPIASGQASDIDRLAAFVTSGKDFERTERLRTAASILHATAATPEERQVLAARLDEAIAAKLKVVGVAQEESAVLKTARVAFDKLKQLF